MLKAIESWIEKLVLRLLVVMPEWLCRLLLLGRKRQADGAVLDARADLMLRMLDLKPPMHTWPVQLQRDNFEKIVVILGTRRPAMAVTEHVWLKGPRGRLQLRIYRPFAASEPRPMLVYFHGGGFVIGSLDSYDELCRKLAEESGANVVSVDYGLAPEHPFPAGLDDSLAAWTWINAHAERLGSRPGWAAVAGDSAGGNLAALVAHLAAAAGAPPPMLQALIYPVTDAKGDYPSRSAFGKGLLLTKALMDLFVRNLMSDPAQIEDPRVALLEGPIPPDQAAGLAPALVLTCGFDPLRDEGTAYAERMKAAGVAVTAICYRDMFHGFASLPAPFPQSQDLIHRVAGFLKDGFAAGAPKPAAAAAPVPAAAEPAEAPDARPRPRRAARSRSRGG